MLKRLKFFSSLKHPAFRLLWIDSFLTSIAAQMQNPLLAWIVMELTDSSFIFGLIMSLRFAPMIVGPMSGVVADRVNRRKLLIFFKTARIAITLILGTLIVGGQIELWHVILIVILQSIIMTLNWPTQSAFTIDIVGRDDITNASALRRISMNLSGLIGPSLVGGLVDSLGIGVFYYLNSVIYFFGLIFLLMIKNTDQIKNVSQGSTLKNLTDGFRYSWVNKPVFGGQLIYFITNLFPIATRRTLMWVFAKNILNADASSLGWLSAGSTLGSFSVTALVAQLGDVKKKGELVVFSSLAWGIMWVLFSVSTSIPFALICLIIMGIASSLTMMLGQVILLINSESEMRGRVTGVQLLAISSQFPGSIIAGAMAETWGEPFAVGIAGVLFVISMLMIMKFVPSLRKTD
jgi:MFS family permease